MRVVISCTGEDATEMFSHLSSFSGALIFPESAQTHHQHHLHSFFLLPVFSSFLQYLYSVINRPSHPRPFKTSTTPLKEQMALFFFFFSNSHSPQRVITPPTLLLSFVIPPSRLLLFFYDTTTPMLRVWSSSLGSVARQHLVVVAIMTGGSGGGG